MILWPPVVETGSPDFETEIAQFDSVRSLASLFRPMNDSLLNGRVAVLGLGKLGGILLNAFLERGLVHRDRVSATVAHTERAEALSQQLQIPVTSDNLEAAREADIILICVKPSGVGALCREISPVAPSGKLIISVAASVPTTYIEESLGGEPPVVRAMPNTPCEVGAGMTGLCKGRHATADHLRLTRLLFDTVGRTVTVDEKHMNAVTGLSASGPAFVYIILESLAEAGVKVGLPRDIATLLAAQTVQGAAKVVLETGQHPALLKDAVTTPAGCTIDGILELEEGKLRVTLIKAVVKAVERAGQLLVTDTTS